MTARLFSLTPLTGAKHLLLGAAFIGTFVAVLSPAVAGASTARTAARATNVAALSSTQRQASVFWNGTKGVTRPTKIEYTGDGTGELLHVRWMTFGAALAKGTATDRVNDCKRTCANGSWHNFAAKITLNEPIKCHGITVYSSLAIVNQASPASSGRFPLRTRCS